MSRKPTTKSQMPSEDSTTPIPDPTDRPVGRRFVSGEVLDIERELIVEGTDLPNRGIPAAWRKRVEDCTDPDELRAAIDAEVAKEHPNQSLIGYLNEHLAARTEDSDV